MKHLNLLWFWLRNIFVFGKPAFSHLDYVDYLMAGKSYFVFSWRVKNAYLVKIKSATFSSYLKSGSAYMLVIDEGLQLKIIVSGAWRSRIYSIELKKNNIDDPIEFPVTMPNNFEVKFNLPIPNTKFSKLRVETLMAKIIDKRTIKQIINISYPN